MLSEWAKLLLDFKMEIALSLMHSELENKRPWFIGGHYLNVRENVAHIVRVQQEFLVMLAYV